jgi:hypothetical protein
MAIKKRVSVMPNQHLGSLSLFGTQVTAVVGDITGFEAVQNEVMQPSVDDSGLLAAADRDQLERDIVAIERASAALRQAEPALQSWTSPPAATMQKPRPVWLLIGVLWLSTALVTLGAVVAISALVG